MAAWGQGSLAKDDKKWLHPLRKQWTQLLAGHVHGHHTHLTDAETKVHSFAAGVTHTGATPGPMQAVWLQGPDF